IEINARGELNGRIASATGDIASGIQRDVLEEMRQNGWMMVGTYFSTFAEVGASLADAQRAWKIQYSPGLEIESMHRYKQVPGLTHAALDKFLLQSDVIERDKPRGMLGGAIGVATDRNETGELSVGQNLL